MPTSSNLRDLRHALRTPLNHIIGYGEMLLEEVDADEASATDFTAELGALISQARELVGALAGRLGGARGESVTEKTGSVQLWLYPRAAALMERAETLVEMAPAQHSADIARILTAAGRLQAFAEGDAEALQDSATDAGHSIASENGKGRLLVVDDNQGNRDVLVRHLTRQGYGVVTAPDGLAALEILANNSFDLVLLDVLMPGLDGFGVLDRIKQSPELRNLPVIVISALDESRSVVRCIQMGAEDYLMKPFDPVLLRARIEACLEKKRLRDDERQRAEELQKALDRLRQTQDQLVVQERLASLGALTAGIAHEIKNPLNFITNFASVSQDLVRQLREECQKTTCEPAVGDLLTDLDQAVSKIEEHGRRADRIVKGMLMHSRGRAGQPELTDLNALLLECANLAYHGLRAHDPSITVRFENDLDPGLEPVRAAPQDLSRVFLNIINNACYAANQRRDREGPPEVRLRSRSAGAGVEIGIRDNGPGIPEEIRSRIFDPFFTTKPSGSGTGLGLSISYEIVVRGHGGTLSVESEPGSFTEFVITLPRERS